jgi:hypothetical protein
MFSRVDPHRLYCKHIGVSFSNECTFIQIEEILAVDSYMAEQNFVRKDEVGFSPSLL